jgi:hypothetical protein
MPGSFSDFCEAKILDHLFGGIPFAISSTLYLGYMVGPAGETGPGAEPNSGNYSRAAVNNDTVNFPLTSNLIKQNGAEIQFEEATSNHGLVQAIGIFDSPASGNMLVYFPLVTPIAISSGDAMRIPVGSLTIQFQTGGLSAYVKNGILNHLLGNVPFNIIPNLYAGYMVSAPTDAVAGTEPSAGSYARVALANTSLLFPPTQTGIKRNGNNIDFAEATAAQGTVTHVGFWDAPSGGNYLGGYSLSPVQVVGVGSIPVVPANTITITLD